jgi:cytochrome c biogenesis protein CcdA
VGYAALAVLVYATALDVAGSAIGGVLGLFSCVSCTWPVLASLVGGVAGGSSAVASAALSGSYGLSTVIFVVTVGLLYWRPFGGK